MSCSGIEVNPNSKRADISIIVKIGSSKWETSTHKKSGGSARWDGVGPENHKVFGGEKQNLTHLLEASRGNVVCEIMHKHKKLLGTATIDLLSLAVRQDGEWPVLEEFPVELPAALQAQKEKERLAAEKKKLKKTKSQKVLDSHADAKKVTFASPAAEEEDDWTGDLHHGGVVELQLKLEHLKKADFDAIRAKRDEAEAKEAAKKAKHKKVDPNAPRPTLTVEVVAAHDLPAADKGGTSDPFCRITCGKETQQTGVARKTLDPEWGETLVFGEKGKKKACDLNAVEKVHFRVIDKDGMFDSDDVLGACSLDMARIFRKNLAFAFSTSLCTAPAKVRRRQVCLGLGLLT